MATVIVQRQALRSIARATERIIKQELKKSGKVASGKTLRSIKAIVLIGAATSAIQVKADESLLHIIRGRRPGRMPPIKSIADWIKSKGIQGRNKKGQFIKVQSLAFAIAKHIAKSGIKGTPILENVSDRLKKRMTMILRNDGKREINNLILQASR